jgi:uncharacterized protein YebE (UPF0316 family)
VALSFPEYGPTILPLLVFLAEMCVVTLGTIRIIFVSRGMRLLAPLLGFFEIMIWLFAISQIMQNLNNVLCFFAFAGGFTSGNFLGILIEGKLAMGTSIIRVISSKNAGELVRNLNLAGYGVTLLEGQGTAGKVQLVLTVVKRKETEKVVGIIQQFDSKAFYSIEEVQSVNEGVFPMPRPRPSSIVPNPLRMLRMAR